MQWSHNPSAPISSMATTSNPLILDPRKMTPKLITLVMPLLLQVSMYVNCNDAKKTKRPQPRLYSSSKEGKKVLVFPLI